MTKFKTMTKGLVTAAMLTALVGPTFAAECAVDIEGNAQALGQDAEGGHGP